MAIQLLRSVVSPVFDPDIVLATAFSYRMLSLGYQSQLRWDLAIKASRHALELCRSTDKISPTATYEPLLATILLTHSESLLQTGWVLDALSIAQEAVEVCCKMTQNILNENGSELTTEEDKFKIVSSWDAFFGLAKVFSCLDRPLESYESFRKGFDILRQCSGTNHLPSGANIDYFIDQICKVAESGRFSLLMLADNVALMRDLARVSPQSFSSQFLHLLHAYVYFLQPENANLSLQNLRVFLEPVSDTESPPLMDRSSDFLVHIDGFNSRSGIIPDLVQACCHYPEILARVPAIKNIFFDHFDEVAPILRTAVSNFLVDGSSYPVFEFPFYLPDILPVLSRAQQVILLQIEAERIQKMRLVAKARAHSRWDQYDFLHGLDTWLLGQWLLGCLAEALAVADEIVEHLRVWSLSPYTEDAVEFGFGSPHPQISRSFILLDMGLFDEAIKAVQLTKTILSACTGHMNLYAKGDFLHHCTIQTRVLVRTGRNQEALQFLRRTMLEVGKRTWTQGNTFLSYFFHLLLVELAVVRGHVGQVELALKEAQRAVAVCRKAVVKKCDRYYLDHGHQQHVLLHSLTTLSNCLASVRRHEEALIIAEEAASVFDSSAPHMWTDFVYGGRRQEFGGNTFHALSRRLATSGQLTKALGSAQKSVDLYRELAGLAPRHLPTLASSLRNLASILWNLGSLEASIAAGEEAVSILGMVAETEPYFLGALAEALDHLAEYHPNERDFKKACSAVTQCADVRRKIALRPPEPDFIFEKLDAESEKEIYQAEDLLYTTVFFALADKALEMSTDISVPEAISDKAESAPQTSNSPQDSGIVGMPGKRLIAESPPEMKSMEILWWSLLVVLGVALAVSCVVSKIDKSE
ncbi:hypothetical protein K438DRAFT_1866632 [Mycena galopus ATCC 62051]|nr:hypothetical protein K438DRAFT_1866632 [Mycena galopus ATCC 62051]